MDFGFTSEALVNNINLLGIEPADLDTLLLSHGHYDHFGGLVGFLLQSKGRLKANLPFYVGGEECFCSREWLGPPVPGNFGALDRQALEQANLAVTYAEGPSLVGDHAFTTGRIGLRSFEKMLSPSTMKIGIEDGIGCFPISFRKRSGARRSSPTSSSTNSPPRTTSKDVVLSFSAHAVTAASSMPSSRPRQHRGLRRCLRSSGGSTLRLIRKITCDRR